MFPAQLATMFIVTWLRWGEGAYYEMFALLSNINAFASDVSGASACIVFWNANLIFNAFFASVIHDANVLRSVVLVSCVCVCVLFAFFNWRLQ